MNVFIIADQNSSSHPLDYKAVQIQYLHEWAMPLFTTRDNVPGDNYISARTKLIRFEAVRLNCSTIIKKKVRVYSLLTKVICVFYKLPAG